MQVALQRLPHAVAKVSVTIAPEDFKQAVDRAFRTVVRRYNIPGFRRGKAPRPIFERFVGREILLQEAAQQLVENRYHDALEQAAVEPVGEPRIHIVSLEDGQPFQFDIEVESKPVVELGDYLDLLKDPLEISEPTPDQLEAELQQLAKSQAQLVPVEDGPVSMGDHIVVSLKGYVDLEGEEELEPFAEEDAYTVEVGSGTMVEGLENQFIGLQVGEPAVLRLTYPENHPDVSLAGKPVRFEVTVQEIKRPDIPSVDDELAKTIGYESEQELREKVANSLQRRLADQARQDRLAAIMGKLKERVTVELPSALVDTAIHLQLRDLEDTLRRIGADVQEYLDSRQITAEALHEEMRPAAENRVKEELILEAVAKAQGISVSDDEVIEMIRPLAESYKQSLSGLVQRMREQGEFEALRHNILLSRAGDYLATTVVD